MWRVVDKREGVPGGTRARQLRRSGGEYFVGIFPMPESVKRPDAKQVRRTRLQRALHSVACVGGRGEEGG